MRKFNMSGITIELEDNFNTVLKEGLGYRDGETLWCTGDIDVVINGDRKYYGYYTGRYPNNLALKVYCKKCNSFVMKVSCNVGGELNKIVNIDQIVGWACNHFPFDDKEDD